MFKHLDLLLCAQSAHGSEWVKIGSLFSSKDTLSRMSKPMTVYKFCCARCKSCYIGETTKVATVRGLEHLHTDKESSVYKHLQAKPECRSACDISCFTAIDHADTSYRLKIKEALHIQWNKPILNKQIKHYTVQLNL